MSKPFKECGQYESLTEIQKAYYSGYDDGYNTNQKEVIKALVDIIIGDEGNEDLYFKEIEIIKKATGKSWNNIKEENNEFDEK